MKSSGGANLAVTFKPGTEDELIDHFENFDLNELQDSRGSMKKVSTGSPRSKFRGTGFSSQPDSLGAGIPAKLSDV